MTTATKVRRKISVTDVRTALVEVVSEDPEHADPRVVDDLPPRYIAQGEPVCLVAKVLTRLGFSVGVLKQLDTEPRIGDILHKGVKVAESRHPALRKIDPVALRLLAYVQDQQDRGQKWANIVGEAFNRSRYLPVRWDQKRKPWLFT